MKISFFVFVLLSVLSFQAFACNCAGGGEKAKAAKTTVEETK